MCRRVLSDPRAKMSSRFKPHDTADGAEEMSPPRSYHCHWFCGFGQNACQRWLSGPRTKASILPGPHDTADGAEAIPCAGMSHGCQVPENALCLSVLSVHQANVSSRPDDQESADEHASNRSPNTGGCDVSMVSQRLYKRRTGRSR